MPEIEAPEEEIEEIPGEGFFSLTESSLEFEEDSSRKVLLCEAKETTWHNRFCGWYNSCLTKKGKELTREYAQRIKKSGLQFDYAFTSALKRTQETLDIILNEIGQPEVEVDNHWLLNARHLGALTGLNIEETIAHYSREQVDYWMNYYTSTPPKMNENHKYYLSIVNYFSYLDKMPMSESYQTTQYRILKYWDDQIVPKLKERNTNIILVCHRSALLAITKYLETQNPSSIVNINIKAPFYYDVDRHGRPLNKIPL